LGHQGSWGQGYFKEEDICQALSLHFTYLVLWCPSGMLLYYLYVLFFPFSKGNTRLILSVIHKVSELVRVGQASKPTSAWSKVSILSSTAKTPFTGTSYVILPWHCVVSLQVRPMLLFVIMTHLRWHELLWQHSLKIISQCGTNHAWVRVEFKFGPGNMQ
jgi:hypothetical protein